MKLRKRILFICCYAACEHAANFVSTTTTAPISSNPLWVPLLNAPPVQRSCCLTVAPVTLPHISDSARLPTSNQVRAEVLEKKPFNFKIEQKKISTAPSPPPPKSIPRLNPLHPPLVLKRTVSLETQNVHHHNHERTLILQRREHFRSSRRCAGIAPTFKSY